MLRHHHVCRWYAADRHTYWDADGTEQTCNFPITGVDPDFGMLGVQGTLCEGVDAIPAGLGDFLGPITGWNLIVPNASSQTSISAEAIYFVYGFGAALGQVSPWTVDFGRLDRGRARGWDPGDQVQGYRRGQQRRDRLPLFVQFDLRLSKRFQFETSKLDI